MRFVTFLPLVCFAKYKLRWCRPLQCTFILLLLLLCAVTAGLLALHLPMFRRTHQRRKGSVSVGEGRARGTIFEKVPVQNKGKEQPKLFDLRLFAYSGRRPKLREPTCRRRLCSERNHAYQDGFKRFRASVRRS